MIVDLLVKDGIGMRYRVPGDTINNLVEAIRRSGRVKYVQVRHEEGRAFASSFDAEFYGGLSACLGTSDPGSIRLLNYLYDAELERA
ncbi:MAG: thiamine pyrophosphate-binding protein [Thermoplasmataceae archaeon]|jgi:pyruvate dehydrogenase (quinone)